MPKTLYASSYPADATVEHNRLIPRVSPEQSFQLAEAGDEVWFFKLPGRGKLRNAGVETATAAGSGQASLVATDGDAEIALLSGIDMAETQILDAVGAGLTGWIGKVLKGHGWRLVLRMTAAPAAPFDVTLRGFIDYTMDVEAGELAAIGSGAAGAPAPPE